MTQRTCTIEGCDSKHLARGMCGTHYNRASYSSEQRHPKNPTPCAVCGTIVMRAVDRARTHCCSPECRAVLQWGVVAPTGYDWAADAMQRARKAGCSTIERVERDEVLARDDWRCYLCDIDTRRAESPFDPTSATVDHVIPLSKGGAHTLDNMRCCCLRCNSAKADSLPLTTPSTAA
jgi:5-methylcytosine-specific restriction endonuclease McrA